MSKQRKFHLLLIILFIISFLFSFISLLRGISLIGSFTQEAFDPITVSVAIVSIIGIIIASLRLKHVK